MELVFSFMLLARLLFYYQYLDSWSLQQPVTGFPLVFAKAKNSRERNPSGSYWLWLALAFNLASYSMIIPALSFQFFVFEFQEPFIFGYSWY
jgi:hypothetical protein